MPNDAGYPPNDTNDEATRAIAGPASIPTSEQMARRDAAGILLREKDAVKAEELRLSRRDMEDAYAAWENKNQRLSGVLRGIGGTAADILLPQSVTDVALMMAGGPALKYGARGIKWTGNKVLTGIRNMIEKNVGPDKAGEVMDAVVDAAKYVNEFGGLQLQSRRGMAVIPFPRRKGSGKPRVVSDKPPKLETPPQMFDDEALAIIENNPIGVIEALTEQEVKSFSVLMKTIQKQSARKEEKRIVDALLRGESDLAKLKSKLSKPMEATEQKRMQELIPILENEVEQLKMGVLAQKYVVRQMRADVFKKPQAEDLTEAIRILREEIIEIKGRGHALPPGRQAIKTGIETAQSSARRKAAQAGKEPSPEELLAMLQAAARRAKPPIRKIEDEVIELDLSDMSAFDDLFFPPKK